MKNTLRIPALLGAVAILLFVFNSCQKDVATANTGGKQELKVYLNDDPSYGFTKVLIDIRYVEVKIDSSRGHHQNHLDDQDADDDHNGHDEYGYWDTLAVSPGVYDLLQLRNGVDTLLATGLVGQGLVTKIRFTLGDNNEVWTDSMHSEPLRICDNHHYVYAGLLTNSIDTLSTGQAIIRIDFNVERSIRRRNGHYCLQPVLRPYCGSRTGEIEGRIAPAGTIALITVYNTTDTAYAIPWWNGKFKVRGLNEGIYSVLYHPINPLHDTTINNVQVYRGRETELPDIILHP
ncbi:hypothetical protein BH11BAC4_BH11BAC4_22140 [soil metagenome]